MRHIVLIAFAAGVALASPVLAADRYGLAGGPPDRSNLPVDPEILPPDTRPGECVNRRVTGPGGAYRWERVECDDGERGWSDFDRWSYGRPPLRVDDRGAPPPQAYLPPPPPQPDYAPDRYSRRHDDGPAYAPSYAPPAYAQNGYAAGGAVQGYSRQEEGYEYSRESRYDSGGYSAYPPAQGGHQGGYGYATWTSAGRDEYGFLVWPGKQP
ncbi:hypothetical protein DDF62_10535 [Caulobacter radicis]|uniref:hypothetical protein n=1 Tax=Caulobacter radicis TaxID=2172650 RepID=UPI000D588402|nr:hypothetical protein DDF62_10535 [Caulobacter radicis]